MDAVPFDSQHARWLTIDRPSPDCVVPSTGFTVSGWVTSEYGFPDRILARHRGREVGSCTIFDIRDDVARGARCGYRVFVFPETGTAYGTYDVEVVVSIGGNEMCAGRRRFELSGFDERKYDYGVVADRDFETVLHRSQIYSVGPPSRGYSAETLALILNYTEADSSIVDVGCGAAPYARPLIASGRSWSGCETRHDLVAEHRSAGLSVDVVDGDRLPFEDRAFDYASCIEVLEHVDNFESFVSEIARVSRRGACFSVPNVRAIPRYAPLGVVPWHLLEASHVNFFGAASLRAVLARHFANAIAFEYGALPIPAVDGTPVFNHVFAVATHRP